MATPVGLKTVALYALALLALAVAGRANAQSTSQYSSSGYGGTATPAYNLCMSYLNTARTTNSGTLSNTSVNSACTYFPSGLSWAAAPFNTTPLFYYETRYTATNGSYDTRYGFVGTTACSGGTWSVAYKACISNIPTLEQCAAKPAGYSNVQYPSGALVCDVVTRCWMDVASLEDGGEVMLTSQASSGGTLAGCDPSSGGTGISTCPTGYVLQTSTQWLQSACIATGDDTDGDGILNNTDPTPLEPGDAPRDSDGDGESDDKDPFPTDPTNGKGTTASKADNTSTGGGNCQTPPVSKGDAIAAQVAYQSWATRCAVERQTTALKSGTVSVGVVGDGSGTEEGDTTFSEVLAAASQSDGDVTIGDAHGDPNSEVETGIEQGFDETGFLTASRTCPNLPTLVFPEFMHAAPMDLDNMEAFQNICAFMAILAKFVLLSAALASIKIYSKVFT